MVFEAIEFPYEVPRLPDDWIHEYLEDLHWLDLSQGVFVVLRDYDVMFHDSHDPQYYMAEWAAELLQSVDGDLRFYRTWNEDGEYDPTPVLYAMDVSRDTLDTVLEFFEGRAVVVPDFDEEDPGAEHPLYVKTKEDAISNLKGITVDPTDTEG